MGLPGWLEQESVSLGSRKLGRGEPRPSREVEPVFVITLAPRTG